MGSCKSCAWSKENTNDDIELIHGKTPQAVLPDRPIEPTPREPSQNEEVEGNDVNHLIKSSHMELYGGVDQTGLSQIIAKPEQDDTKSVQQVQPEQAKQNKVNALAQRFEGIGLMGFGAPPPKKKFNEEEKSINPSDVEALQDRPAPNKAHKRKIQVDDDF